MSVNRLFIVSSRFRLTDSGISGTVNHRSTTYGQSGNSLIISLLSIFVDRVDPLKVTNNRIVKKGGIGGDRGVYRGYIRKSRSTVNSVNQCGTSGAGVEAGMPPFHNAVAVP